MNIHSGYFIAIASIFLSVAAHAKNVIIANEVKNNDGSVWVVEKNNDGYTVKYINAKGKNMITVQLLHPTLKEVICF